MADRPKNFSCGVHEPEDAVSVEDEATTCLRSRKRDEWGKSMYCALVQMFYIN